MCGGGNQLFENPSQVVAALQTNWPRFLGASFGNLLTCQLDYLRSHQFVNLERTLARVVGNVTITTKHTRVHEGFRAGLLVS